MASSFEVADPTVDSQVLTLANTKADVFLIYSVTPRACAQAVRKAHEVGWQPKRFIATRLRQQGHRDGAGRPRCRQGRAVARLAQAVRRGSRRTIRR